MRQRAAFSQGGLPFRRACLSIQCDLPSRTVEIVNIATTQHRPPYSKAPDGAGPVAAGPCRVAWHLGSHLNLIKADQRAPTASLMFKRAGALPVDLTLLSSRAEWQLETGLREVFGDQFLSAIRCNRTRSWR